ncbi:MAG: hypothetical protein LBK12_06920 [Odoribacteraceae bacterium]|jgi:hypothetical protein|nr:hypothetical protein [Odoribacteraceae bacterium]
MEELAGKWKYRETYTGGEATGELSLRESEGLLAGKIIFTDRTADGQACMIQETVSGHVEGRKVKLEAMDYDVIHPDTPLHYELDTWFGIRVDDATIIGMSMDAQGVEGRFIFEKA